MKILRDTLLHFTSKMLPLLLRNGMPDVVRKFYIYLSELSFSLWLSVGKEVWGSVLI